MHKEKSSKRVKSFLSELIICSSIVVFSIVFLAIEGCRPAAEVERPKAVAKAKITKGPFLLRLYQDRAALMWETEENEECRLYYGRGKRPKKYIKSRSEELSYEVEGSDGEAIRKKVYVHKVWLEGLEAGEVYRYRVEADGSKGEIFEFRTVPKQTDEVRFVVYGDSRSNPEGHRKIVEQIISKDVDFVVNSGDLVGWGGDYELWEREFFAPMKGLAETVPVYIAKGNHDLGEDYYERLLQPPGEGGNYGFDYGPVHYFCADNVTDGIKPDELIDIIASDAKDSKSLWKFVSYHYPSLNFGGHWSRWGGRFALSSFSKAGIDFVVTGHSHQYERFRPVKAEADEGSSYVSYITSGGGGAPLYEVEPSGYHFKASEQIHFCLFEVTAGKLSMESIDIDGWLIDRFEVSKADGQLDKEYIESAVPAEAIGLHYALRNTRPTALSAPPQENESFTVEYRLKTPDLTLPGEITFKLRSEDGNYELPEAESFRFVEGENVVEAELTCKALAEVRVAASRQRRAQPMRPELFLDCSYRIGWIEESISHRIAARPAKK